MTIVAQSMTPNPVIVSLDTSVRECVALMDRHHTRRLVLTTNDGKVAGWVPRDVAEQFAGDLDATRAVTIAAPVDKLIAPTDPLGEALDTLLDRSQDFLVAVDAHRRPVGILTDIDALELATTALPTKSVVDIGTTDPFTVPSSIGAPEAWKALQERAHRHLIVVDDVGDAVGVVSERDLIPLLMNAPQAPLGDLVATGPLETVPQTASIADAARLMVAQKVGCVPVVDDDGTMTRILTRFDVLLALREHLDTA